MNHVDDTNQSGRYLVELTKVKQVKFTIVQSLAETVPIIVYTEKKATRIKIILCKSNANDHR